MKNDLISINSAFVNQYKGLLGIQSDIISQLKEYSFDLSKLEITEAIIERMDGFWYFHVNNNKDLLGRNANTIAADFFTETCLLFVKLYFNGRYVVKSEANIDKGNRKSIRPDISIWKDDKLMAVLEIKVSNGWKSKNMMEHLKEREIQLKGLYPNIFFGVIAYWNFFDMEAKDWNKKYIGLKTFDEKNQHPRTDASIEKILSQMEEFFN